MFSMWILYGTHFALMEIFEPTLSSYEFPILITMARKIPASAY